MIITPPDNFRVACCQYENQEVVELAAPAASQYALPGDTTMHRRASRAGIYLQGTRETWQLVQTKKCI